MAIPNPGIQPKYEISENGSEVKPISFGLSSIKYKLNGKMDTKVVRE